MLSWRYFNKLIFASLLTTKATEKPVQEEMKFELKGKVKKKKQFD